MRRPTIAVSARKMIPWSDLQLSALVDLILDDMVERFLKEESVRKLRWEEIYQYRIGCELYSHNRARGKWHLHYLMCRLSYV